MPKKYWLFVNKYFLVFVITSLLSFLKIWAPVVTDWQCSSSVEGLHSMKFSSPKWSHYNSELQACVSLPFVFLPLFLLYHAIQKDFFESFLKYNSMWQQRHCSILFGEQVAFRITLKFYYHWPGFTLDGVLLVTWDIRETGFGPQLHPQQQSFMLGWSCMSVLSHGSCRKVAAVFWELRFRWCAYRSCLDYAKDV